MERNHLIETVQVNDEYSNARLPSMWSNFLHSGMSWGFSSIDMLPQLPNEASEGTLANSVSDSIKRRAVLISCKHIFDSMIQLIIFYVGVGTVSV